MAEGEWKQEILNSESSVSYSHSTMKLLEYSIIRLGPNALV